MIRCPSCKNQEPVGAIFCSECGSQVLALDGMQTQKIEIPISEMGTAPMHSYYGGNQWITLQLVDSGEILPIADMSEFTVGRVSENQPIMPDVDLTPYRAFDNGVSRLHAVFKHSDKFISLTDLGSANGTYINGIRIAINVPQNLRNGDIVSIGKLKMQVIFT